MSPARSRDSVRSATRLVRMALSPASASRRSAMSVSAKAPRTSATRVSPSHTRRWLTDSRLSCAAAMRRGRCHKTSNGNCTVHSNCLGPHGKSSDSTGFRSNPASTRSARARPRSASTSWNDGLFQRAIATASSAVSPSSSVTPGGRAAPSAGLIVWPVRSRSAALRSTLVVRGAQAAHITPVSVSATRALTGWTLLTGTDKRHHHPASDGNWLQRDLRFAVTPDDGPANGFTESRTKDDVAEEVPIVYEPRRGHVAGRKQRRPGSSIAEVALEPPHWRRAAEPQRERSRAGSDSRLCVKPDECSMTHTSRACSAATCGRQRLFRARHGRASSTSSVVIAGGSQAVRLMGQRL